MLYTALRHLAVGNQTDQKSDLKLALIQTYFKGT